MKQQDKLTELDNLIKQLQQKIKQIENFERDFTFFKKDLEHTIDWFSFQKKQFITLNTKMTKKRKDHKK